VAQTRGVDLPEPHRTRIVEVNRTTLRLWEWGDPADPAVICVHGAFDHGRMFDELAPSLADHGYHVVAPDLRGHGDSGRLSSGHAWSASAIDLAELALLLGAPVGFVGHSFGGGQSLYVAAAWPERVRWVVNIDGLGAPTEAFDEERDDLAGAAARSLDALERLQSRAPRTYATLEEMAARRGEVNVRLPEPWRLHLARHGARLTEGGWTWKVDPVFTTGFPTDFGPDVVLAQYRLVRCPVLALTATEDDAWTDLGPEETAARVAALGARHVPVPGAGHYVHVEKPAAALDAIRTFVAEVDT
jgi:pimeloyl-ACP methyl ester carboxylesterase